MNILMITFLLMNIFCSSNSFGMQQRLAGSKRGNYPYQSGTFQQSKKRKAPVDPRNVQIPKNNAQAEVIKAVNNMINERTFYPGRSPLNKLMMVLDPSITELSKEQHFYALLKIADLYHSIFSPGSLGSYEKAIAYSRDNRLAPFWRFDALMGAIHATESDDKNLSALFNEAEELLENSTQKLQFYTLKANCYLVGKNIYTTSYHLSNEVRGQVEYFLNQANQYRNNKLPLEEVKFLLVKAKYLWLLDNDQFCEFEHTINELYELANKRRFRAIDIRLYFDLTEFFIEIGTYDKALRFLDPIRNFSSQTIRNYHVDHLAFQNKYEWLENLLIIRQKQAEQRKLRAISNEQRKLHGHWYFPDSGLSSLDSASLEVLYPHSAYLGLHIPYQTTALPPHGEW